MFEGFESFNFGLDEVNERVVVVEDLDGETSAGGVLGKLDLAGDS